jgi:septum formation protein
MRQIILASISPRRKKLLDEIALEYKVDPSDYEEVNDIKRSPQDLVLRHSFAKVLDVSRRYKQGDIIIGADTIVLLDNEILGKPTSEEDAFKMLKKLSGRTHSVITGIAVKEVEGATLLESVRSEVHFKPIDDNEIREYIATGEPMDKAGAYAIQGIGEKFIERVDGCYHNVVGLPILRMVKMLSNFINVSQLNVKCDCE